MVLEQLAKRSKLSNESRNTISYTTADWSWQTTDWVINSQIKSVSVSLNFCPTFVLLCLICHLTVAQQSIIIILRFFIPETVSLRKGNSLLFLVVFVVVSFNFVKTGSIEPYQSKTKGKFNELSQPLLIMRRNH